MQLEGFVEVSAVLRCGVYALVAKGVVIYVGKSKAVIARVNAHRRKWIDKRKGNKASDFIPIPALLFDEVYVYPCTQSDLDRIEEEMINRYKPKYNVQLKTTTKVATPFTINVNGIPIQLNQSKTEPVTRRI